MEYKRFLPKLDKLFWLIFIPTSLLLIAITVIAFFAPAVLFIIIPCDLLCFYCLLTTLFGYVELRESCCFVKLGFFMKREIPYEAIRGITKERKIYSDSMLSLKNSLEHINIKYNRFDILSVSVKENDELISELENRINAASARAQRSFLA